MYTLDTKAAKKADQTGTRINELGKYIGQFKQAKDITATTGTKGVALRFESSGQTADLSIYTQRSNGETIMGFQILMAIMTCLQLRSITPKEGKSKDWDNSTRKEVEKDALLFPDLCGKDIGLLLETEDYIKNDGGTGTRMVIAGIFQAKTELTATEILDKKTTPEHLEKMVSRLRHRHVKGAAPKKLQSSQDSSGFDEFPESDLPF